MPINQVYYCKECDPQTFKMQPTFNTIPFEQCLACPEGFECPGGSAELKILPGYWSHTNLTVKGNFQNTTAYSCN